jgi:transposase-like protein
MQADRAMTERKAAMSLRLSQDEMDTLAEMADELGMPRVSLIRQWIRDAARRRSKSAPMSDPVAVHKLLTTEWAGKIRRA